MTSKLVYNQITYDKNHWSLKVDEEYVIRYVTENNYNFVIMCNPTDCRGYRILVKYLDTNFNRKYTNEERKALLNVTSNVCTILERFDLITQIEVAGNNSHYFKDGITYVGTEKEPCMLHSHIICRGNPNHNYIGNVSLRGPEPGHLFNMREGKIPWSPQDLVQITVTLDNIYESMFKSN